MTLFSASGITCPEDFVILINNQQIPLETPMTTKIDGWTAGAISSFASDCFEGLHLELSHRGLPYHLQYPNDDKSFENRCRRRDETVGDILTTARFELWFQNRKLSSSEKLWDLLNENNGEAITLEIRPKQQPPEE